MWPPPAPRMSSSKNDLAALWLGALQKSWRPNHHSVVRRWTAQCTCEISPKQSPSAEGILPSQIQIVLCRLSEPTGALLLRGWAADESWIVERIRTAAMPVGAVQHWIT